MTTWTQCTSCFPLCLAVPPWKALTCVWLWKCLILAPASKPTAEKLFLWMKRSYLHQCHLNTQPHPNKAMKNLVEYFNHALRSEKDDRLCTLMSNVHEHELVTVKLIQVCLLTLSRSEDAHSAKRSRFGTKRNRWILANGRGVRMHEHPCHADIMLLHRANICLRDKHHISIAKMFLLNATVLIKQKVSSFIFMLSRSDLTCWIDTYLYLIGIVSLYLSTEDEDLTISLSSSLSTSNRRRRI